MGFPRRLAVGLAAASAAATALISPASTAAADTSGFQEYVALGDSFTASTGYGLPGLIDTRWVPLGCGQSRTDYPHQVARLLGVPKFTDASCGAATTRDFTHPQKTTSGEFTRPQYDRLTPTTDLVTIGIGGNDVGLVGLATDCLQAGLTGQSCRTKYNRGGVDRISEKVKAALPKVVAAVEGARERSPEADIYLVNYLESVPDNGKACYPFIPVSQRDMKWFSAKFKEMNAMLATAAEQSGAGLIDIYSPTIGHNACTGPTTRYVELTGVSANPVGTVGVPMHPNQSGANAQSQLVYAHLTR